jgi:hypothetical protein
MYHSHTFEIPKCMSLVHTVGFCFSVYTHIFNLACTSKNMCKVHVLIFITQQLKKDAHCTMQTAGLGRIDEWGELSAKLRYR